MCLSRADYGKGHCGISENKRFEERYHYCSALFHTPHERESRTAGEGERGPDVAVGGGTGTRELEQTDVSGAGSDWFRHSSTWYGPSNIGMAINIVDLELVEHPMRSSSMHEHAMQDCRKHCYRAYNDLKLHRARRAHHRTYLSQFPHGRGRVTHSALCNSVRQNSRVRG